MNYLERSIPIRDLESNFNKCQSFYYPYPFQSILAIENAALQSMALHNCCSTFEKNQDLLVNTYISLLDKIGHWVFINTRNLDFIDSFYGYFGIHDVVLLTLGILLYRQIIKTKNRTIKITEVILYVLLFFYFFPDFSATFEAQRVIFFEEENGNMIEGFNLLYVWGRFPTYWLFGISIALIDKLNKKKRTTTTPKSNAAILSSTDTDAVGDDHLGS